MTDGMSGDGRNGMNGDGRPVAHPRPSEIVGGGAWENAVRGLLVSLAAVRRVPPVGDPRGSGAARRRLRVRALVGAVVLVASLLVAAPAAQGQSLGTPGLFAGTQTATSIRVNWSITDPNIKTVRLERSDDGGNSWTLVAQVASDTTFRDVTGLTPGTAYQFRIQGCDVNVQNCGSWSPGLGVSTQAAVKPGTPTLSGSPVATTVTKADLSWNRPLGGTGGLTGYDVEQRPVGEEWGCSHADCRVDEFPISVLPGDPVEYTTASFFWDRGHEWRVRAKNAHTVGDWSNVVKVAGVPTGLGTLNITEYPSSVQVGLDWAAPTSDGGKPITGYRVEWREDATGDWNDHPATRGKNVPAGRRVVFISDVNDGLKPGTTYNFRYRAHNEDRASYFNVGDGSVSVTTANITSVSIADASAEEGDPLTFTVSLTHVWTVDVVVNWQAYDASPGATNGADFTAQGGTVTIPTGQTSATITVNTIDDARDESDEQFSVSLTAPSGGLPANVIFVDAFASGTITDNDTAPGAPTGLSASATEATIRLAWIAPTAGTFNGAPASISGYQYRTATSTGDLPAATWIDTGSVNTSHDVTVGAAGTHYFQVRALTQVTDADGFPAGAVSSTASAQVTLSAAIAGTDPSPLRERTLDGARLTVDLVGTQYVSSLSPGQFGLVPGVSGLSVESVNRVSDKRAVLTLGFDGNIGSDVGLRVQVRDPAVVASATLTTGTVTVTQAPRPPRVSSVRLTPGPGSLEVSWRAATNADGYVVRWKRTASPSYDAGDRRVLRGASTTQTSLGDLLGETGYDVGVWATSDFASDGWVSWTASATTLPAHAIVSATNPSPLTENNLGGATLTVDLLTERSPYRSFSSRWTAEEFAGWFTVSGVPGVSIAGVSRVSDTRAAVTLAYDVTDPATDFDADATLLIRIGWEAIEENRDISAVTTVRAVVEPPPGPVTGVRATPGPLRVHVSWDEVSDATGYRVEWSPQSYSGNSRHRPRPWPTSHTIGALQPASTYTVRVVATKTRAPDGPRSAARSATTPAVSVRLAATEPSPLSHLNGARLTVDLTGVEWETLVGGKYRTFQLGRVNDCSEAKYYDNCRDFIVDRSVTVSGVERVSASRAVITLRAGDVDLGGGGLWLRFPDDAHTNYRGEQDFMVVPLIAPGQTVRADEAAPRQVMNVRAVHGDGEITVYFDRVEGAEAYRVQWKRFGEGNWNGGTRWLRGTGIRIFRNIDPNDYEVRVQAYQRNARPQLGPAGTTYREPRQLQQAEPAQHQAEFQAQQQQTEPAQQQTEPGQTQQQAEAAQTQQQGGPGRTAQAAQQAGAPGAEGARDECVAAAGPADYRRIDAEPHRTGRPWFLADSGGCDDGEFRYTYPQGAADSDGNTIEDSALARWDFPDVAAASDCRIEVHIPDRRATAEAHYHVYHDDPTTPGEREYVGALALDQSQHTGWTTLATVTVGGLVRVYVANYAANGHTPAIDEAGYAPNRIAADAVRLTCHNDTSQDALPLNDQHPTPDTTQDALPI